MPEGSQERSAHALAITEAGSQRDGEDTRIDMDLPSAFFSKFPEMQRSSVPALLDAKLTMLLEDSAVLESGLGGRPVCSPLSVAKDLFPRVRCELDHDRSTGHAEQLDADVYDCPT
jgi:hypothetical protein